MSLKNLIRSDLHPCEFSILNNFLNTLFYDKDLKLSRSTSLGGADISLYQRGSTITRKAIGKFDDLFDSVNYDHFIRTASFVGSGVSRLDFANLFFASVLNSKVTVNAVFGHDSSCELYDLCNVAEFYSEYCKNTYFPYDIETARAGGNLYIKFSFDVYANIVDYSDDVSPELRGEYKNYFLSGAYNYALTKYSLSRLRQRFDNFLGYAHLFHGVSDLNFSSLNRFSVLVESQSGAIFELCSRKPLSLNPPLRSHHYSHAPANVRSSFFLLNDLNCIFSAANNIVSFYNGGLFEYAYLESWITIEKYFGCNFDISETLSSRLAVVFHVAWHTNYSLGKRLFKSLYRIRSTIVHERNACAEDVRKAFRTIAKFFEKSIISYRAGNSITLLDESLHLISYPDRFVFPDLCRFMFSTLNFLSYSVANYNLQIGEESDSLSSFRKIIDSMSRELYSKDSCDKTDYFSSEYLSMLELGFSECFLPLLKN
ncbi:hypothetical protein [Fundidesulfovibrio soli]|uniref:hypothetical protein n=1 Tax=Fundidesulfovibrio soli TaxID=2922716 RepID=UPI001FAEDA4A|nr:hypothetical protein [Fundidesulfovibrio soli]